VSLNRRSEREQGRFAIGVGGLVVTVETRSTGLRLGPLGASQAFRVEPRQADLTLEVVARELAVDAAGRLLFDSNGVWRLFDDDGAHVYRFHDTRLGRQPYKEARLRPESDRGEILVDPRFTERETVVDPLEFPLDELLFQRLLAARGGVELHAAGIVAPSGQGFLFAGQSGDGKTTTARLWQQVAGCTVLSDDRIVVRRVPGGGWSMYGTPWHGEAALAVNAGAPLAAVFVLARGSRTCLEELSAAQAVATLFARSFPPIHDQAATRRLLGEIEALVSEVPCRRLPFVPDAELVPFVLENAA
jgi:hypothetical protein